MGLDVRMAPSWHQNRTEVQFGDGILPDGRMNLCDIDLTSHVATMQIIVNQYFVAFDSGCTILKEFKDMMAHQSQMANEGANEEDHYWELIWANLGCGLTMISGFCTAINPIDFTIWTSIVFSFGLMMGILMSSVWRCFTSCLKTANPYLCCLAGQSLKRRARRPRYISLGEYLPEYMPALDLDSNMSNQEDLRVWQRKSPEKEHELNEQHQQKQQCTFKDQQRTLSRGQSRKEE